MRFFPVQPWKEKRYYKPIPNTESIWIDKNIVRDQLTAFVRSMHDQGLLIENFVGSTRSSINKTVKEVGTPRVLKMKTQFIREADFQRKWNEAAIKFQKKLLEVEPLGEGVTGTVTIPNHRDIAVFNATKLNQQEIPDLTS